MRISEKSHQPIRQNEETVRKSHKHDVNLQKNSTLYFQIGLIVCLLTTYGLLEMKFETKDFNISERIEIEEDTPEVAMKDFKIYEEPVAKKQTPPKESAKLIDEYQAVEDDHKILEETNIITPDNNVTNDKPLDPSQVNVEVVDEPVDVPFYKIEQAPIYPGCENKKTNTDRKKCMSDKINKLVQRKFNSGLASEYGLTGIQKIDVQFKIDQTGRVTNILTRAPHPKLQEEAERVVSKIPKMIPGKQRDTNVGVIYNLPIKFQVQD